MTRVAVVGMANAASTSTIIAEYFPASRALKDCLPQRQPPRASEEPRTSSILLMIEPMIEALTTEISPCCSAKMPIIISGALPKVALSRPPVMLPTCAARSSVAKPINAARGIRLMAAQIKMASSCRCPPREFDNGRKDGCYQQEIKPAWHDLPIYKTKASLCVDFFRCFCGLLCFVCIDYANGNFGMHLLRDPYGHLKSAERANRVRHFNSAAIKGDALGFIQASGDILAGDRSIETPLAPNPGLEGERHLG